MKPSGFAIKSKKTPFQKHKEAEEERKKKADEEAARVYEEFVESFSSAPEPKRGGGFVRGGTVLPGSKPTDAPAPLGVSSKKTTKYVPSFLPPSAAAFDAAPKPKAFDDDESVFQAPAKKTDKDKPRNIDKMLEQLKKEQEMRDKGIPDVGPDRGALGMDGGFGGGGFGGGAGAGPFGGAGGFRGAMGGSFDSGDPFTTNLYVGNLAQETDEEVLKREFGRFGAIASVKVMWPRDEEQRRKGRNCGFVAFMKRDDAEMAMRKLQGIILHGNDLHIGWGKAIPLPAIPIYDPREGAVVSAIPAAATRPAHLLPDLVIPKKAYNDDHSVHRGTGTDIEIKVPDDPRLRYIIDTLAVYVLQDGCALEQAVMEAEQKNYDFSFLFDLKSTEHLYYRWRLHSLSEGDTLRTWRIEPYCMVHGGQRWVPPPMTTLAEPNELDDRTAAQKADGSGPAAPRERERPLSDSERDRFEDMLRFLTVERSDICDAMMFCLSAADACGEIVDILAESLSLSETAVPLKIARLFLLSDLLHNATAPVRNASRYRVKLQAVLPDVFESLNDTYRGADGRMLQEALRRHVLRVLRCWRDKYIFTDDYLNGLQAVFLTTGTSTEKALGDNPGLRAELEAAEPEELERRAKLVGLSNRGGKPAMINRFLILDHYLHADSRPVFDPTRQQQQQQQQQQPSGANADAPLPPPAQPRPAVKEEPDAAAAPAVPQSRWTTVDEQEERQKLPQMPISKWLLQEQDQDARLAALEAQLRELDEMDTGAAAAAAAQAAAQAAAAAAGAGAGPSGAASQAGVQGGSVKQEPWRGVELDDDDKIFSDDEEAGGPGAGGAEEGGTAGARSGSLATPRADSAADAAAAAAEEERRRRLREVELSVARLEAELEEQGVDKDVMAARLAARRAELVGELDREQVARAASLDKWRSRRGSAAAEGSEPGSSGRDRERGHDRDRDRRDRDRDREKDRDRDRDRDRERDRDSKSHKESKSKDKDKDKDRDRERDRDRDRDRDRERDRDKDRDRERDREGKERKRSRSPSRAQSRDKERRHESRSRSRSRGRDSKDKRSRR
ncbi:hypothetical protein HXX76_004384 [Chlamydomonas incerta]|uniref:Uncharacterized protein n=1 Tax=Chlamydomonas incerta TaxID=51695 RepID=A0A835T7C7_CHLIN|nr:hypothetical protein HXX76_004384 [Chlamydomonas incerta]|eukprot:KAG2440272.1 hypothetical protein HXX76_004384 [Chlamydomonas incerta]